MTHTYSLDNKGKRGARWMLMHCAICGDLLQRYDVSVEPRDRVPHGLCGCTADLQRCRRRNRDDYAKQLTEVAARAAAAPVTRPDYSDQVTKLGA